MPGLKYDVRNRQAISQALLAKGFLCLPIRASCFIIGAVSLVTSFILMGGLFATLVGNASTNVNEGEFTWIVSLIFCAVGLDIIASALLLVGSLQQRRRLVVPYATLNFVLIFMGFLAIGLGSLKETITWKDTAISLAMQGVSIYVWMIVVSYYQIMADNSIVAEKLMR